MGWMTGGFESQQGKKFLLCPQHPDWLYNSPSLMFVGYWFFFFSGVKQPEHEVDHLHVLLRLRVSEAVLSLLLYTFMACMGTALPIFVYLYLYNICLNFFSMFQMCAVAIVAKSQKDFLVILRRRI